MNQLRYSERQILFGLREVWQDVTGTDELFYADTRIDTFMKTNGTWDEIDFYDVFRSIERFFDFQCTDAEWQELFAFEVAKHSRSEWEGSVAPNLTFGALARFIANRAPAVTSLAPITLLGRQCAPAGVFLGLQDIANKVAGPKLRFPPSARIRDVLRGDNLDSFWNELRWMSEQAIPELPVAWRNAKIGVICLAALALVIASIIAWFTSNAIWIVAALMVAIVSYLIAAVYKHSITPLPPSIVTFRDLAIVIAMKSDS